jgi:hypothetical protein
VGDVSSLACSVVAYVDCVVNSDCSVDSNPVVGSDSLVDVEADSRLYFNGGRKVHL